jgi:hypothetical protein
MGAKRISVMALALLGLTGWPAGMARVVPGDTPSTERFFGSSALGWQTGEQVFQRDGGRSYGALLASLDGFPSPKGPTNASLVVNCSRGTISVAVVWPSAIAMDVMTPQDVQWRFDDGARQNQAWMTLPNVHASSSPSPRDFLAAMRGAHRLEIGTSDHGDGGKIEAVFDLDGGKSPLYRQVGAPQVVDRVITNCPQ